MPCCLQEEMPEWGEYWGWIWNNASENNRTYLNYVMKPAKFSRWKKARYRLRSEPVNLASRLFI